MLLPLLSPVCEHSAVGFAGSWIILECSPAPQQRWATPGRAQGFHNPPLHKSCCCCCRECLSASSAGQIEIAKPHPVLLWTLSLVFICFVGVFFFFPSFSYHFSSFFLSVLFLLKQTWHSLVLCLLCAAPASHSTLQTCSHLKAFYFCACWSSLSAEEFFLGCLFFAIIWLNLPLMAVDYLALWCES